MHSPHTEAAPLVDRRKGPPPAPMYGELLIDSGWRPNDLPPPEHEGWLRTKGVVPDRRQFRAHRG
jgi:hypothetical protein